MSSQDVTVRDGEAALEFQPTHPRGHAGLVFICGSGIHPHAYAPLLRPIAEAGFPVFIVKLPYRFAPLASHKDQAVERARRVIADHPGVSHWVVAGHSLGGALAARVARAEPDLDAAYVLIATTHPKDESLAPHRAAFTKVYATNDRIAPVDRILASRALLPAETRWVEIAGGNHSQFGNYGHQLFDGDATISREAQQAKTRDVLLENLRSVAVERQVDVGSR